MIVADLYLSIRRPGDERLASLSCENGQLGEFSSLYRLLSLTPNFLPTPLRNRLS